MKLNPQKKTVEYPIDDLAHFVGQLDLIRNVAERLHLRLKDEQDLESVCTILNTVVISIPDRLCLQLPPPQRGPV